MELIEKLKKIFFQFKVENTFESFETFSSGHINDTYLILTKEKPDFILQRINGNVFKEAAQVIENKVKISQFLLQKGIETIEFVLTKENKTYYKDTEGSYWNVSLYIENSCTLLQVKSNEVAYEAGRITGVFLAETENFKGELFEVLPNFHTMSFRFQQFDEALVQATEKRKIFAEDWINFTLSCRQEMLELENAINRKEISLRVTHNDTKISNILFTKEEKAICLIDLDTVMQGVIHFDYGDALRTICSTATEDETDLSKVDFNINYFRNYTKGFLETIKKSISEKEKSYLSISIKTITFIMGLRFLTDYLNNDVYYKVNYKDHNLNRSKNQFTLVKRIKENHTEIDDFINNFNI